MDATYRHIVEAVIRRVAIHLGATGEKGRLIAVFTGASADFAQAVDQIKGLILTGYSIETVFSKAGYDLYGETLTDMLAGFPNVEDLDESKWLTNVNDAVAVVVPMLSLNTLSRIALLMADNVPSNIILRALFSGTPVIMAQNGAVPEARHWQAGAGGRQPPLVAAVRERLDTVTRYGGHVVNVGALRDCVVRIVGGVGSPAETRTTTRRETGTGARTDSRTATDQAVMGRNRGVVQLRTKVVTASQVRMAHAAQSDLLLPDGAKISPLAMDIANRLGVKMSSASM